MTTYTDLDPELNAWAKSRSVKLITSFGGYDRRYFYTSSAVGECFQISVDLDGSEDVTINAWSVETLDDDELHASWRIRPSGLGRGLDRAMDQIEQWKRRELKTATEVTHHVA